MKELLDIFPKNKKLSEQIYKDFEEVYSLSKLQVNAFHCLTRNFHLLQLRFSCINEYYIEGDGGYGYLTYPFMDEERHFFVNPYRYYTYKFDESSYMEILNEVKEKISEDMTEDEIVLFLNYKIDSFKKEIINFLKKQNKKYGYSQKRFIRDFKFEKIIEIFN